MYRYDYLSPQAPESQTSAWLLQRRLTPSCRIHPAAEALSLTHKSSQDFSGTGSGSASTTEILGIYSFNTSLEQL